MHIRPRTLGGPHTGRHGQRDGMATRRPRARARGFYRSQPARAGATATDGFKRYPHGESNPGFRTENPTSWATRRWGRGTFGSSTVDIGVKQT